MLMSTDWEGAAAVCGSLPNEETENEKKQRNMHYFMWLTCGACGH
jgi:hypothetical protein